jgi:uncharacterized membrane protein
MQTVKTANRQKSLSQFIRSSRITWYLATLILSSLAAFVVILSPPESQGILVYAHYALGSSLVLWFPGYTFAKAVLPWRKLGFLERISFSLALSLALVAFVGLAWNYTTQGVETVAVTLTLLTLTLIFATAAIVREYVYREN